MRSKPFYTQISSDDTSEMQKKNDSYDTQEISLILLIEWDLYNECLQCLPVPPVLMQECRRLRKLVIGLKNTPYENLNIFKPA